MPAVHRWYSEPWLRIHLFLRRSTRRIARSKGYQRIQTQDPTRWGVDLVCYPIGNSCCLELSQLLYCSTYATVAGCLSMYECLLNYVVWINRYPTIAVHIWPGNWGVQCRKEPRWGRGCPCPSRLGCKFDTSDASWFAVRDRGRISTSRLALASQSKEVSNLILRSIVLRFDPIEVCGSLFWPFFFVFFGLLSRMPVNNQKIKNKPFFLLNSYIISFRGWKDQHWGR